MYYVPGIVFNSLHIFTHSVFNTTFQNGHCHVPSIQIRGLGLEVNKWTEIMWLNREAWLQIQESTAGDAGDDKEIMIVTFM